MTFERDGDRERSAKSLNQLKFWNIRKQKKNWGKNVRKC